MKTWTCSRCGRELPLDAFRRDTRTVAGRKQPCRACHAASERGVRRHGTAEVSAPPFRADSPLLGGAVLGQLGRRARSLKALALALDCRPEQAREVVAALQARGYQITETEDGHYHMASVLLPVQPFKRIAPPVFSGGSTTFGVVADTHMCNMHERLDVVEAAYDEFAARKITTVYHAGNIVDGFVERINGSEVKFHRPDDQINYCLDHYPSRPGITTHYLSTYCHEGWWRGIAFGPALEMAARAKPRTDLVHLGLMEADIPLSPTANLRIVHPRDGCAYATSYPAQKHVESYQPGEKPSFLILGHYHKMGLFFPRGVWTLLAPCSCDQTGYMRGKRIEAQVGYDIVTIRLDKKGSIAGVDHSPRPMWNRKFYAGMTWAQVKGSRA